MFWSSPGYHGSVTRVISVDQTGKVTPFLAQYREVPVALAAFGQVYADAQLVPVRGNAPAQPAVPSDAVTASASGLDPDIGRAYAKIQERSIAAARGVSPALVQALVSRYSKGRDLGFLGEPRVNVLELNLALDRQFGSGVKGP